MKQIENEKLNQTIKEITTLNLQREMLNNLNELLSIYPELIKATDDYYYQKYTDKKYITDGIKNSVKTILASIASIEISEEIINTDIPLLQKSIIAFIGSLTGWLIFQIENSKNHQLASLNKKEILEKFVLYEEKLCNIVNEFVTIIYDYAKINGSEKQFDLKEAFDNNEKYITNQKQINNISYNFNYKTIVKMFEEIFGENSLENCINEVYYSINKTENKNITRVKK